MELIREKVDSTVEEVQKSQVVRLIDVFFIAPFLVYASTKSKLSKLDKYVLLGLGVATLYYNGVNYLENKKTKVWV